MCWQWPDSASRSSQMELRESVAAWLQVFQLLLDTDTVASSKKLFLVAGKKKPTRIILLTSRNLEWNSALRSRTCLTLRPVLYTDVEKTAAYLYFTKREEGRHAKRPRRWTSGQLMLWEARVLYPVHSLSVHLVMLDELFTGEKLPGQKSPPPVTVMWIPRVRNLWAWIRPSVWPTCGDD